MSTGKLYDVLVRLGAPKWEKWKDGHADYPKWGNGYKWAEINQIAEAAFGKLEKDKHYPYVLANKKNTYDQYWANRYDLYKTLRPREGFSYSARDLEYMYRYLKENYSQTINKVTSTTPIPENTFHEQFKVLGNRYTKDELRRRRRGEKFIKRSNYKPELHGWNVPGYNFCGPGNTLDHFPTTMLDAICMYHDYKYAFDPNSQEIEDDKIFKELVINWGGNKIGNGFTGPTYFEAQFLIPMILAIFHVKQSVAKHDPWVYFLMPEGIQKLFTGYKDEHHDPTSDIHHQTKHVNVRPDKAFDNMLEAAYMKIKIERGKIDGRFTEVKALDPLDKEIQAYQKHWSNEEVKEPGTKNKNVETWDRSLGQTGFEMFETTVSRLPGTNYFFWVYKYEDKLYPVPITTGDRDDELVITFKYDYTPSRLVPSGDPNRKDPKQMVPYFVEQNRKAVADEIIRSSDVNWKPIYASWGEENLQDITRQADRKDLTLSHVMETYRNQAEADRAAPHTMETETRGKKRPSDDTAESEEKKPKVETIDPSVGIEQPKQEVAGKEASVSETQEDIVKEEGLLIVNQPIETETATVPPPIEETEQVLTPFEMSVKKFKNNEVGLTGQVSIGLAPDRNFISAPGHMTLRFERVIRNICLLSHGSTFGGTVTTIEDTVTTASLNPYKYIQPINASLLHLDDNSIALTTRDKDYLDCLPIRRMKLLGGKITFSGMRIMENELAPTTNLRYTQSSNPIQNMDRKIQYKYFDRERDYQWNFSKASSLTSSGVESLRDYKEDVLTNNILRKDDMDLGNKSKWSEKALPMACITSDDDNMVRSSRLFEMMEDHAIADGEIQFPIMGHPFWISVGRNGGSAQALNFTTGKYPGSSVAPSALMGTSFVNFHSQSIAEYVRNQRYAKCNSNGKNTDVVGTGTGAGGKLLKDALTYRPMNINCFPSCEIDKTKCDEVTSSHCAILHVPTYPTSDGNAEKTVCMADVTLETTVKVDLSKVRNGSYTTFGVLGEIWEDTVDPLHNSYVPLSMGINPTTVQKNREQWYTPYFQAAPVASLGTQVVVGKTTGTSGTEVKTRWMRAAMAFDSGDAKTTSIELGEDRNSTIFSPSTVIVTST